MSFREIDEAYRTATALPPTKNRGRKRKGSMAEGMDERSACISERRTGRWTNEEMAYCDKLMAKFESGEIPVSEGTKLNEFLGNMLKSKQSRLTKKMKNAKLSTRMFQRRSGCLEIMEAREFSELEESFFQSVTDLQERAEIKFHMQKEWREQFSRVCGSVGQPLDADTWLTSVEEMDRRASKAKDAARMTKRKIMMGIALRTDTRNLEHGVFIERTDAEARACTNNDPSDDGREIEQEMLSMFAEDKAVVALDPCEKSSNLHSAPFLAKAITYLQRHCVPFEHVDLWVPSFVPSETNQDQTSCRLCYAGSSTVDKLLAEDGKTSRPLAQDEVFNFYAFGDYSQKFFFDVGCGLPGRVYESGRPTWEQCVQNAPDHHFERCGGANQWGIKTVLGIPIASPNVGRIVVTLYSCFDRNKDEDLVSRLSEEFTRLMPSPKWKLVVDIGDVEETSPVSASSVAMTSSGTESTFEVKENVDVSYLNNGNASVASVSAPMTSDNGRDRRIDEVVSLLGRYMPYDNSSPHASYQSGFMHLRLLLLRQNRNMEEEQLARTMLDSYSSYIAGGRESSDIAIMLASEYHLLTQQQSQQFLGMNQNYMTNSSQQGNSAVSSNSGLSLFGLPLTRSSLQNSPALTPIPAPGSIDGLSIVSN
jgi:hypothetical protein